MAAQASSGVLRSCSWVLSRCSKSSVSKLVTPQPFKVCLPTTRYLSQQSVRDTFSKKFNKGASRIGIGVGIGLAIASGYGLYELNAAPDRRRFQDPNEIDTADGAKKEKVTSLPKDLKISRKAEGPTDFLDLELVLFQYQSCPFCCKVRAFLDYYGIPYSIVEVNPVLRSEIKFSEYKKVPILMIKDSSGQYHQLNDSSAIVSILGTYLLNPERPMSNILPKYQTITYVDEETKKKVTQVMNRYFVLFYDRMLEASDYEKVNEERKWRIWVDDHLVHMISPNIYRTWDESKESFEQFSVNGHWEDIFSSVQRMGIINIGALAMYFIGKRLKKKYNLEEDVRTSLYNAINKWTKALKGKTFMGGTEPNLADLAVYGVLNSFEGCRAFKDIERETKVARWYTDVKSHLQSHSGASLVPKRKDNKRT